MKRNKSCRSLTGCSQRLSYYREMRGPVLLTIGESVMANLDHINQSHYSLDVIEFQSELCDTQSPFTDTIGMNEKCRKLITPVAKSQ